MKNGILLLVGVSFSLVAMYDHGDPESKVDPVAAKFKLTQKGRLKEQDELSKGLPHQNEHKETLKLKRSHEKMPRGSIVVHNSSDSKRFNNGNSQ
jgi:hypothetical protein